MTMQPTFSALGDATPVIGAAFESCARTSAALGLRQEAKAAAAPRLYTLSTRLDRAGRGIPGFKDRVNASFETALSALPPASAEQTILHVAPAPDAQTKNVAAASPSRPGTRIQRTMQPAPKLPQ